MLAYPLPSARLATNFPLSLCFVRATTRNFRHSSKPSIDPRNVQEDMGGNRTHISDKEYLESAINRGDLLSHRPSEPAQAKHRALIVAPLYMEFDGRNDRFGELKSIKITARDARLMHQTLCKRGYKAKNIRILAEGFKFAGSTDVTRENVLNSLDWLVHGARDGDYRFFYFSGHGERYLSQPGEGKQARRVPPELEAQSDDTEAYADNAAQSKVGRITEQAIPKGELVYYKEAIITQLRYGYDEGLEFRVQDKELNQKFSQLPAGCTLTCVMDCCASGRIINNAIKVAGDGIRGKPSPPVEEGGENQPVSSKNSNPSPLMASVVGPGSSQVASTTIDNPAPLKDGVVSPLDNVVSSEEVELETITIHEALPQEEIAMDQIKANAYTWAACHQRQGARPHPDHWESGLLTTVFTEALDTARKQPTVGQLFHKVSTTVKKLAYEKGHGAQYVQLRVSPSNRSKENLEKLLEKPFDF